MNSKRNWTDILNKMKNNKKLIPISFALAIVIIGLLVIVIIKNNKKVIAEPLEKHTEAQSESLEGEFFAKCAEYNNSVSLYNSVIGRINNFRQNMEALDVLEKKESLPTRKYIDTDYDAFVSKGIALTEFDARKQEIDEDCEKLKEDYVSLVQEVHKSYIDNYNQLAKAYNDLVLTTSIDNIDTIPSEHELLDDIDYKVNYDEFDENDFFEKIIKLKENMDLLAGDYLVVSQIINPSEEWIIDRIANVEGITEYEAVTSDNDPNGLLGKEGGYTSCIYFSYEDVDQSIFENNDVVAKGTDCGGAIEVYKTKDEAINRCDYLSQFDGTLLYSGSYALVGTIIIRTSYKLDDNKQIELTNMITKAFTELK